ncbi:hypothetical protein RHMOL_Rhmol03G0115600 [Rhododendron molle]|uniref:Uncharacterized protein n=1 Tax=Rhododendron molle TaxID=49168 RepID=A0ACC0PE93_RHOML|nr:hypothetical protein RHMOL_Rhmol03G0115600 [Rhododendron molle]
MLWTIHALVELDENDPEEQEEDDDDDDDDRVQIDIGFMFLERDRGSGRRRRRPVVDHGLVVAVEPRSGGDGDDDGIDDEVGVQEARASGAPGLQDPRVGVGIFVW